MTDLSTAWLITAALLALLLILSRRFVWLLVGVLLWVGMAGLFVLGALLVGSLAVVRSLAVRSGHRSDFIVSADGAGEGGENPPTTAIKGRPGVASQPLQ
jgi:hypothetical protein